MVVKNPKETNKTPMKSFTNQEKKKFQQVGAKEENNKWTLPDGREILLKGLAQKVMMKLHEQTHWGTQALVDQFENKYVCV